MLRRRNRALILNQFYDPVERETYAKEADSFRVGHAGLWAVGGVGQVITRAKMTGGRRQQRDWSLSVPDAAN